MKSMNFVCRILVTLFLATSTINLLATDAELPHKKLLLDFNWKFHLGDDWPNALRLDKAGASGGPASPKFNDDGWRTLNLPHDWVIELPFDKNADGSHGFKPVGPGFPKNSVGWYRRTFDLPAKDSGKRIWLDFDGSFRDTTVWVNGWLVGRHESGYYPFRYDITDIVNFGGTNTIAVKVDASKFEGWFYEGAGIYRHVWLEKTSPVAIAPDGVFVWSEFKNNTPDSNWPVNLRIQTQLNNTRTNQTTSILQCEIISPNGDLIGKTVQTIDLKPQSGTQANSTIYLFPTNSIIEMLTSSGEDAVSHSVILWSPENPKLYKLVTTVEVEGKVVDRKETEFGIRTVAFDKDKGFLLNGQPYELKGTCNHQDMAGVGAALPDALQYFRVKKLKEFGDNAYRTSHNPPTPELLEACDRLGMIVMDESRLLGSDAQNMERWQTQILRDRNHPSVCIWSIANEEFSVQDTPQAANVARTMQDFVKQLDPTRPVTYASPEGDVFEGVNSVIEVRGWNYHVGGKMDQYHAEHPDQPEVGTEQASTVSTRGIYANDKVRGYVSAYDDNAPSWAHTAEHWWSYFDARPWLSGGFVWTGFDYRGEPTPYSWPCINSHFGVLDTCGFPKDNFYYYQSWWTTNVVLHLLPHWNWPGKEGQEIRVDALSNCKAVELFLNGASLGKQTLQKDSKLTWQVKYTPGTLSAKGFDDAGNVIAQTKVETTGEPTQIQLTPDRKIINADGEDVSVFTVSALDAQGRVVPVAMNKINFNLSGAGKILGVGNGDPSCHEPDTFVMASPVKVIPFNDWRWHLTDDVKNPNLAEFKADFADSGWDTASSEGEASQLAQNLAGIFRQHIHLSAEDLASSAIEIQFGRIDDLGWIYVNGQRVGESRDWSASPAFEIKKFLHEGDNVVTVGVQNIASGGGIGLGVYLQIAGQPIKPEWSRSLFNGLAEVIVQSTKDAGEIQLTAGADGLKSATATIQTMAVTTRPFVP
ncbi:MAG TPA: beta-galactosidase GalA [Verrucomicrobiae bacterium]|nr:beta-galactosidase GalA [Verrucomicrobiae bacterium]